MSFFLWELLSVWPASFLPLNLWPLLYLICELCPVYYVISDLLNLKSLSCSIRFLSALQMLSCVIRELWSVWPVNVIPFIFDFWSIWPAIFVLLNLATVISLPFKVLLTCQPCSKDHSSMLLRFNSPLNLLALSSLSIWEIYLARW